MSTISIDRLWAKLRSRRYRNQFVSAQARRMFAFQLRAIMKKLGISQQDLAKRSGLTQGVISRAADPNYGKLTTTVKVKIANGLDMAYFGVLVPFSKAVEWTSNLSEESVQVPTFEEEDQAASAPAKVQVRLGRVPLDPPTPQPQSGSDDDLPPQGHRAFDRAVDPKLFRDHKRLGSVPVQ